VKPRILVVDDEPSMREMLRIVLRRDGYDVKLAANGTEAFAILQRERVDLLLSDIRMPDVSGVEVLRAAKKANPDLVAFMMTAFASTDTAVEAMRLGAVDYFTKPFDMDELRLKVRRHLEAFRLKQENVLLKRVLNTTHEFCNIIGRSDAMLEMFKMVETIAKTSSTVLITGESGTGKDLVARAVHYNSLRREHPFVALNCGGLPETLLESELFGHMKGAFTGADTHKKGLVEVAERGTIFLDEIGEMSQTMQVKLLRVLQDRRFRRLGGTEEVQADIRVIAATNQDLQKMVAEGRFREDLYYRINVIQVHLPPLRERREDVPLLAEHFLAKYAKAAGRSVLGISNDAQELLSAYAWPGNVRELQNVIERIAVNSGSEPIQPEDLPPEIRSRRDGMFRPKQERRRTVADDLYQRLVEERQSFWSVVYPLYMQREITRSNVRDVVRKGLQEARGNYKIVARLFNMEQGDYKRFLNFLRKHDCQVPFKEYR
jgi:two-component system, NtrC family, response regulator PilR